MAAKKKIKKKPVKKTVKKGLKRTVKKKTIPKKKTAKKTAPARARKIRKPAPKAAAKKRVAVTDPGVLSVQIDPALTERLKALAISMAKSLDQVLAQALGEFADTWEDHGRTVAALSAGDDRMQLVVPQDEQPKE